MRGHLSGYEWVWFYPRGIANILSVSRVRKKYRVTFGSAMDNCFHVHKDHGKTLQFQKASRRLYYFDTVNRDEEGTMLITTVDNNKTKLSVLDLSQAKRAQALQTRIRRPSIHDYIHYVNMHMMPNCTITVQDVKKLRVHVGPWPWMCERKDGEANITESESGTYKYTCIYHAAI